MSLSQPEMVLLDLDGTMVDTVPDLTYCLDNMLHELSLPEAGETKVREWVGNGIERLVKRGLTNDFDGEPDASLFEKALPIFIDSYRENACKHSQLYAGVREGLDYLANNGFKLGCVTNKLSQFTNTILETLNIQNAFGIVISGDTLAKKKPDPLPLLHAAEYFGVKPEQSLMIGDSVNDVSAARAAGFQVLCVSYGYNLGQDIRLAKPDYVVDSLADLVNIFQVAA
ncbi:MAG: phosphoglycolate phosphatase [Gammaproteobacteria bacterium]|nr:MAG: phosphoglycolate phosphatase [Gammaproteobacteria bacterium]